MNGSSGAGGSVALVLLLVLLSVALYVWTALALSALFRKAGRKAWQGWVPFLNQFMVLELGGMSGWLVLLLLVPFVGPLIVYVLLVFAAHRINAAFGHGGGMTVLAALLFPVWASVLGFGPDRWLHAPQHTLDRGCAPAHAPEHTLDWGHAPEHTLDWLSKPVAGRVGSPAHLAAPPAPAPEHSPEPAPQPVTREWPMWAPDADLDDDLEVSAVATGAAPPAPAAPAAPAPSAQPLPPARPVPPAPLAPPALVTRAPFSPSRAQDDEPWAPRRSRTPSPDDLPDEYPDEMSGEVSAVIGAPEAGSPRSALSAVSALHMRAEAPDAFDDDAFDDDAFDQTVITHRRRGRWALVPSIGAPIDLRADVVILGRSPAPDPAFPRAQLVSIADDTRTVSKTHARLELRGDTWVVTDLGSTNGVLLVTLMGTELEAEPGVELAPGERFFLGDAEVRLQRTDV